MRKRVLERLELVKAQSWDVFAEREEVGSKPGAPTAYLAEMGLEKRDLKLLERAGMAVRGYYPSRNDFGKPSGWHVRWILIR